MSRRWRVTPTLCREARPRCAAVWAWCAPSEISADAHSVALMCVRTQWPAVKLCASAHIRVGSSDVDLADPLGRRRVGFPAACRGRARAVLRQTDASEERVAAELVRRVARTSICRTWPAHHGRTVGPGGSRSDGGHPG